MGYSTKQFEDGYFQPAEQRNSRKIWGDVSGAHDSHANIFENTGPTGSENRHGVDNYFYNDGSKGAHTLNIIKTTNVMFQVIRLSQGHGKFTKKKGGHTIMLNFDTAKAAISHCMP